MLQASSLAHARQADDRSLDNGARRARRIVAGWPWASILTVAGALLVWEAAVRLRGTPAYLLPAPSRVAATLVGQANLLWPDALVTGAEMLGGLALGTALGIGVALAMAQSRLVERALGPLLVVSQALPVFAIAPLLVVWLGFGVASKLAMVALIIFFPVSTSLFEGLRRTPSDYIDLGRTYAAGQRDLLMKVRLPAALPALCSGLKVAAAIAPLGAIVGEWVGSSSGLGLVMLHANARMQTDTVFAGLAILAVFSLLLWGLVGALTRRLVFWAPDTLAARAHSPSAKSLRLATSASGDL